MSNSTGDNKYDLEDRTAKFGIAVISLCKSIAETTIIKPLVSQLIRSATSIGANYLEANGASSRKDFANKILICKKEAQESRHWLRMLLTCCPERKTEITVNIKESQELAMIFHKIAQSTRSKDS